MTSEVDHFAYLYEGFLRCPRCRFYTKDKARLDAHVEHCDGQIHAYCSYCRFDAQSAAEVYAHLRSRECVNELLHICEPLWKLDYDVLNRTKKGEGETPT